MALLETGITAMKFFPAEAAGGAAALRALAGPLPSIRFCPTGGISPRNAADYLALGERRLRRRFLADPGERRRRRRLARASASSPRRRRPCAPPDVTPGTGSAVPRA